MAAERKQNGKIIVYIVISVILAAALLLFTVRQGGQHGRGAASEQVVIAVPYSEWVQDYETNYYTAWLEEKTGCDITFVYLDEGYERESLDIMLTSEESGVDAVFFPEAQEILSVREYRDYIRAGCLCAPQDYLAPGSRLQEIREAYPEADFERLLGEDGRLYCFPALNISRTGQNLQILWINIDWLSNLGLTIPQTAGEFYEVLVAFRDRDPNGNGIADELPLVSCEAGASFRSYQYLLNAFTCYDVKKLSWYVEDGALVAGVEQEAFRDGLAYCARLCAQGLLVSDIFPYTEKQLMELVNDPADTVGAFASHSIADVVYTGNPDVLTHFVQLAPLSSDVREKGCAIREDVLSDIGGLIPANAVHKEEAARIMDVMLSEEAARIALYGEEGVDWRDSRDGELSTYGTYARVATIRYLKGERQNKNYAGAGPLLAAAEYTDGVTWNGDHSMMEYIDARAVKAYEAYYVPSDGRELLDGALSKLGQGRRSAAADYLERELLRFITGERKVEEDRDWESFLEEYRRLVEQ